MSPVRDLSRTHTRLNGGSAQHRLMSRRSSDRWRIAFEATALAEKDYRRMKDEQDEPEPEPGQNQNGNFDKAIFHELSVRRAIQAKRNLALKEKDERKEFAELDRRARLTWAGDDESSARGHHDLHSLSPLPTDAQPQRAQAAADADNPPNAGSPSDA